MLNDRNGLLKFESWKAELLLLISSVVIYFLYFHHILLNINSVMSSITSDTLKNYYTFAWHIRHDHSALHFSGMNYPFGEHVVYTDCQPVLCFILRLLPFTHNYSIGILHGLIFLSFMVTPLVVRRILLALGTSEGAAWFCGLGLSLLSPQYLKLNAGHFGLAYPVLIPLAMLWLIRYMQTRRWVYPAALAVFNVLVFLLHPYLGFGLCVLCGTVIFIFGIQKKGVLKNTGALLASAILPVTAFTGFMKLTDHHKDRPLEPYGLDVMVENTGSLFAPDFGPFRPLLEYIFPARTGHFEGHTYLGVGTTLMLLFLPVLILLPERKKLLHKPALILLFSSLVFLFVSFGLHRPLLQALNIRSSSVDQFRAVCRFAWFFYYGLILYLICVFDRVMRQRRVVHGVFIGLFFLFSAVEAHFFFRLDEKSFWQWRNIFNAGQITAEEKACQQQLLKNKPQCILPLPVVYIGSEIYERTGDYHSLVPAMISSYHSGVPLSSMMASRTSISETEMAISVLNAYQAARPALENMNDADIFVIKTGQPLMPDEDRAWAKTKPVLQGDSISYGLLSMKDIRRPLVRHPLLLPDEEKIDYPVHQFIYRRTDDYEPFRGLLMNSMHPIARLPANSLAPGRYIYSFRYYGTGSDFRAVACNVVFARDQDGDNAWITDTPMRYFSGFYEHFNIYEQYMDIRKDEGYVLLIYGHTDRRYRISHLMIRPAGLDVITTAERSANNFPR